MDQTHAPRIGAGEAIAFLGAALILYALFQPWYSFRLPEDAGGAAGVIGGGLSGQLEEAFRQGLMELARTPIEVTGWQAFGAVDVMLAAVAAGAAGLALVSVLTSAAGVDRTRSRLNSLGMVALALVGFRILAKPDPAELLSIESGAWMALAGAAAIVVGGWLAVGKPQRESDAEPATVHPFPDLDLDQEPEPLPVAAAAGERR